MKLFTPDDFDGKVLDLDVDGDRKFILCYRDAQCIAAIANTRLKEMLEQAPVVYWCEKIWDNNVGKVWVDRRLRSDTHQARLIDIEAIK